MYDPQNIFARILRKEIPCEKVHETSMTLALADKFPKAKVHILVIPKGAYICFSDFMARASEQEVLDFNQVVAHVIQEKGLDRAGCRLIANQGVNGGQEVPHYHVHILGGESLKASF